MLAILIAGGCAGEADGDVCVDDPRAEVYAADLEKVGDDGVYSFILEASSPGPPLRGDNVWAVKLLDASGTAVVGASLYADTVMPVHGHGSAVVPTVEPGDDDDYVIEPLYFFMAGLWQVDLTAAHEGTTDHAAFTFCVED